jgi:hypothetical protein
MRISGLISAAVVLIGFAHAAPAQELMTSLKACRAQTNAAVRLSCFDALVSDLDSRATTQATVAKPAAGFGGENLVREGGAPRPQEAISAGVAKVSFSAIKHFTVVLDNGQVWRQADSDTAIARFRDDKPNVVKISKGFMDSYNLAIEGTWGTYKVKRIK